MAKRTSARAASRTRTPGGPNRRARPASPPARSTAGRKTSGSTAARKRTTAAGNAKSATTRTAAAKSATTRTAAAKPAATRSAAARTAGKRTAAAKSTSKARPKTAAAAAGRGSTSAKTLPRRSKSAAGTRKTVTPAARPSGRVTPTSSRPGRTDGRARRTQREQDHRLVEEALPTPPSSLNLDRRPSAARSGREELREALSEHTATGPALTAGDVDADWQSAYSTGDEAPGGDMPTPDQAVVQDIGTAMGVEYNDDEELKGVEKIEQRDRRRWELDPASSEDYRERAGTGGPNRRGRGR